MYPYVSELRQSLQGRRMSCKLLEPIIETCRCSADQKLRLRAIFNTQYKGLLLIYSISLSRIESCLTTYWTSRRMEVSNSDTISKLWSCRSKQRDTRVKNKENNTQRYSSWQNLRPVMLYCCVIGRVAGRGTAADPRLATRSEVAPHRATGTKIINRRARFNVADATIATAYGRVR